MKKDPLRMSEDRKIGGVGEVERSEVIKKELG